MKIQKISLIMPVYNEEQTLAIIIEKIFKVNWGVDLELVIVNDCSKDSSANIINSYKNNKSVKILHNSKNMGKSQTVKRGILASTGDIVAIQDSDLEYDPNDLLKMLKLFQTSQVDVVYGNRFGVNNEIIYYSNWFGNRFLSFVSSCFTYPRARIWTSDMETCYKMVKGNIIREIAPSISAKTNFGFEPEITARLAKYIIKDGKQNRHIVYHQIPIAYYARTIAQGKKMKGLSDGTKALFEIFRYNLSGK
jgi:glycosyltransferase involved in cell wall biosynthesis